jgi:integrase
MSFKATTSIFLDTRRKLKDKTYPVKIRVTNNRKRKYYSTGISLNEDDFEKVIGENPRGKYRTTLEDLEDKKLEADQVIRDIKKFSFAVFEKEYLATSKKDQDLFSLFDEYIKGLKKEDRIGTADTYQYALNSLKEFTGKGKLAFEDADPGLLKKYEAHMLKKDRSVTTVSIYLRSFKTIINIARASGLMDTYPFGKGRDRYQIKNPPARKMALSTAELKKIFEYIPKDGSAEHFFFDLWKFSYLCGGMNVKDICMLKWKDVVRDKIYYKREKTKRSNFNGTEIVIPTNEKIRVILDRWGNKEQKKEEYVFTILSNEDSLEQARALIRQANKQINKYINRVCEALEVGMRVTTYTARHSYATQLMRHGAPTKFISKQLGHSSVKTTHAYLEHFEEAQIAEWQQKVTEFNI